MSVEGTLPQATTYGFLYELLQLFIVIAVFAAIFIFVAILLRTKKDSLKETIKDEIGIINSLPRISLNLFLSNYYSENLDYSHDENIQRKLQDFFAGDRPDVGTETNVFEFLQKNHAEQLVYDYRVKNKEFDNVHRGVGEKLDYLSLPQLQDLMSKLQRFERIVRNRQSRLGLKDIEFKDYLFLAIRTFSDLTLILQETVMNKEQIPRERKMAESDKDLTRK